MKQKNQPSPSHELHLHQHQLAPAGPLLPSLLQGFGSLVQPLSCPCWDKNPGGAGVFRCPRLQGILQILKVPSNVSQRRGELGRAVGLGEII